MFPFLLDLCNYVTRCWALVKNIVRQLANFYHPKQKGAEDLKFNTVWKYLGTILEVLITLNAIISHNAVIMESWGNVLIWEFSLIIFLGRYKRMIKQIKKDPEIYNVQKDKDEKLWQFEEVMHKIHATLLDGGIFKKCILQTFDEPGKFQVAVDNPLFKQVFWSTIKAYHTGLIGAASSTLFTFWFNPIKKKRKLWNL